MSVIKNKKEEMKDRLAALMIYLELKECTNPDTFISSTDLMIRLEDRYGKENVPSHNTVAKYLKAMAEYSEELGIDVRKGNSRQGYCLADREFSVAEINLFIEAILNSKTLTSDDKKEMIDKCYTHLGFEDAEVERLYDYLFDVRKKRKKQRIEDEDMQEILNTLQKAIDSKTQIRFQDFPARNSSDREHNMRQYVSHTVSPYKIFTYGDISYLMYGFETRSSLMKPFMVNYKPIHDIHGVRLASKKGYYPIENYEPFKNGIDETKLRKDPFKYIREGTEDTVRLEIIVPSGVKTGIVKRELQSLFREDVEFGTSNGRNYAYISGHSDRLTDYLFQNSNKCIVVGPEKWKKSFKRKLGQVYKNYGGRISEFEIEKFAENDNYIETSHNAKQSKKN